MADFGQINETNINPFAAFYQSQDASNKGIASQQDMADRATLRGLAPGLATRDPNAVAGAAVLPGVGGATSVGTLGTYDSQTAAAKLAALEFGMKLPGGLAAPVGGAPGAGAPGAGAGVDSSGAPGAAGGASTGTFAPGTPFVAKDLPSDISPSEDAMVRTVSGEAGNEPLVGQQAVASVIKNRATSAGVSPQDVVFSPKQFSMWNGGKSRADAEALSPSDPRYQAILNNVVRPVMSGQTADPTQGATHYYAPSGMPGGAPPSWAVGQQGTTIGTQNFYKLGYGPAAAPSGRGVQVAGPGAPTGDAPVIPSSAAPGGSTGAGAPPPGFGPLAAVPGAPVVAPAGGAPPPAQSTSVPPAAPGGAPSAGAPPASNNAPLQPGGPPVARDPATGLPAASAAAAPVVPPDDHDHDHAISVAGAFMQSILAAPPEQRAAMWTQSRPAMLKAGALNAPVDYPGDQVASAMVAAASDPAKRAQAIAGVKALGGGVQVAGPGAPTAPAGPPTAPTTEGGPAPAPVVAPVPPPVVAAAAPPPAADNASAPVGGPSPAAAPPPALPNQNTMLGAGPVGAAPVNALLPPAAVPPVARPTFMPAASAAPPPAAPAAPARSQFDPPPGAQMVLTGFGTPFPGAGAGMAFYQVPGVKGMQQFRNPGEPEPVQEVTKDGQVHMIGKITGREIGPPVAVGNDARMTPLPVAGGTQMFQSGHPVGAVVPYGGRPEQVAAYKEDADTMRGVTAATQAAQASMPRMNEMADLINQVSTGGVLPETRAKISGVLASLGFASNKVDDLNGLSQGSAAQLLTKLAVSMAGAQGKENAGSNNGIQSTQLYQAANPGMNLLPDANKRVTNMLRVASQATQDYGQAASASFDPKQQAVLKGGEYTEPLTTFNRAWAAQNNPQVYAAATAMLNGDPFPAWSARITPAEAARAASIAQRIDPTVKIPMRDGSLQPVAAVLGHPAIAGAAPPAVR